MTDDAAVSGLEALLVVQEHDTRLDQLRHRHTNLPERAELESGRKQLAVLDQSLEAARAERHQLQREQQRYEDEVSSIRAKISTERDKLYGGSVNAVKELQALQDEIASLERRQSDLEDHVLEYMEQIEPITETIDGLDERRTRMTTEIDAVAARLDAAAAELDREISSVEAERAAGAEIVGTDLLAEYEQLRSRNGGIGVARLNGATCGGCRLRLSAVEIDRIRKEPPDAMIHCEECGRLLVR